MAVIKCSECGAMIPEQSAFCPECGAKVKRYCRKCGTLVPDKALFCPKCGTSVKNENKCNKCGTVIPPNASWCPNCGAPVTGNANVQSANAHANNARQQGPGQDVHSHVHGEKRAWTMKGSRLASQYIPALYGNTPRSMAGHAVPSIGIFTCFAC